MIKLYANAAKVNPTNENLATQWFMSLARTLDFKGQQMVKNRIVSACGLETVLFEGKLTSRVFIRYKQTNNQ